MLRDGTDVALIDCGLQKDRSALIAGLAELGIAPGDVRTLLLTHAHCDHAGNAAFFAAQGAEVVTHHDEARFLALPRRSYSYRGIGALRRPFSSLAFTIGERLYPVERCAMARTVDEGDIIPMPNGALRVLHTPGHTPGHAAFYREQDGVLFSGDAVLNIIPVKRETGLSLPVRLFSDDWTQARQSARRVAELGSRLLLSGHGLPLTDDAPGLLRDWARSFRL